MPVPTTQPQRCASRAVGAMPASAIACSAAVSAKRCDRLPNLSSLRSPVSGSESALRTSAAMRVEKPLASKFVIGAPQERPSSSRAHIEATSLPAGTPRPAR